MSDKLDIVEVFAVPGAHTIVDGIHPSTGLSLTYNQTIEEIRARYPGAERMPFADWTARRVAEQDAPIVWTETTREQYWEMLCVLPPAAHTSYGFMVGEAADHHVGNGRPRFAAFLFYAHDDRGEHGNARFFSASRPMTIAEFRAITPAIFRQLLTPKGWDRV